MTIANEPGMTLCDWTVSGMDCASCATKVRGAVSRLDPQASPGSGTAHHTACPTNVRYEHEDTFGTRGVGSRGWCIVVHWLLVTLW